MATILLLVLPMTADKVISAALSAVTVTLISFDLTVPGPAKIHEMHELSIIETIRESVCSTNKAYSFVLP